MGARAVGSLMELRNPAYLRRLIADRGYTPASFARSIGTTPSTLNRILAGTRRASPAMAGRIALALDVGVTVVFAVPVVAA